MNNNINDSYCSFRVSELFKQKGLIPAKLMGYVSSFYHPKTQSILRYGIHGKRNIDELIYRVPQHIAIEWLRVNHNIWVDVGYERYDPSDKIFWYSMVSELNDPDFEIESFYGFSSPQDAIDEALYYTLTQLLV